MTTNQPPWDIDFIREITRLKQAGVACLADLAVAGVQSP